MSDPSDDGTLPQPGKGGISRRDRQLIFIVFVFAVSSLFFHRIGASMDAAAARVDAEDAARHHKANPWAKD